MGGSVDARDVGSSVTGSNGDCRSGPSAELMEFFLFWVSREFMYGVGAMAPSSVPPAIAFHIVRLLLFCQDWYGSGAPNTGFNRKKGSLAVQICWASVVSLTSWSARALGSNSFIHMTRELCLHLM